jgi:uncharacterized damage-inducible protein DinB
MRYHGYRDRLGALAAEQSAVLRFCRTLSAEEWVTPSGGAGWTVKDVVAHMAGGYHGPFQSSWIRRVATASEAEQQGEHDVSARRTWTSTAVVAEFDVWERRFLRVQAGVAARSQTFVVGQGAPRRPRQLPDRVDRQRIRL